MDFTDQAKSDEVAATINLTADFGGKCLAIGGCDVVQLDQVAAAFAQVAQAAGKLDILVNNAGVGHVGTDETTTDEDMDRMYNVNVKGVFHATQVSRHRPPALAPKKRRLTSMRTVHSKCESVSDGKAF